MTQAKLWSVVRILLTILAFGLLLATARCVLEHTAPMWTDESIALVAPASSAIFLPVAAAEKLQMQGVEE